MSSSSPPSIFPPSPTTIDTLIHQYGRVIIVRETFAQARQIVQDALSHVTEVSIQDICNEILRAKSSIEFLDHTLDLGGDLEQEFFATVETLAFGSSSTTTTTTLLTTQLYEWAQTDLHQYLSTTTHPNDDSWRARTSLGHLIVTLHWTSALEPMFLSITDEAVSNRIRDSCKGIFDQPFLTDILRWARECVLIWLRAFSFGSSSGGEDNRLAQRLDFFVHETLQDIRQGEIFDLVTSFPDSKPALLDFSACLLRTHSHQAIAQSLGESLTRRLLHSGVSTNAIILVYIKMKRALAMLDSRHVIFDRVAPLVKQFLRDRPETVRCVVTALTNDGSNSELHQELGLNVGAAAGSNDTKLIDFDEDEGQNNSEDFFRRLRMGDKDDGETPSKHVDDDAQQQHGDILGELVRIYTSKEVFVHEFKSLLAARLIQSQTFDLAQEIRGLELLKLKFGDAAMRECDIMIKDVEDSRRTNNLVQPRGVLPIESVIVSRHFWPKLAPIEMGDKAMLHPWLRKAIRAYGDEFLVVKKPKKIVWLSTVGFVSLDVIDETGMMKTYENCSIMHANVLCWLIDQTRMNLGKLVQETGVATDIVKRHVSYWISEGVVKDEGNETYACAVHLGGGGSSNHGEEEEEDGQSFDEMEEEEEEEGVMDNVGVGGGDRTHENQDEEMDLGVNTPAAEFVLHMLTNLGALGLEAIHRNLTLFGMPDWKPSDLAVLLDNLVVSGAVEMRGGSFVVVDKE